ncbi:hypothetical protein M3Y97_00303300 [Aphelenchoides bicaudatus]|nr:hypothetical protein M3Y97_00303300 [Aphelenchoides bicaudatus]
MFYGQFILAKKGPLAKVWFAAHFEKKLSRSEIFDTDVNNAVAEVLRPKVKLSLRLNGNLLLGIVRIYSRKASYVLHDLERAKKIFYHFVEEKQRQVRRVRRVVGGNEESTIVEEGDEMGMELTLPHLDEFGHPPGPSFNGRANNSDITLHEHNPFLGNGDLSYMDQVFEPESHENFDELMEIELERMSRPNSAIPGDELVNRLDQDLIDMRVLPLNQDEQKLDLRNNESSVMEDPRASIGSNGQQSLTDPQNDSLFKKEREALNIGVDFIEPMEAESFAIPDDIVGGEQHETISESNIPLDPLSTSQIQQAVAEEQAQRRRAPRRRRRVMLADEITSLDDEEMRKQMNNIKDIVVERIDIAPPTKRVMIAKNMGSLAYIFNNPATNLGMNASFLKMYNEHCVLKARPLSDVPTAEQIREDMNFTAEPQLDHEENRPYRSRSSSRAASAMPPYMEANNYSLDLNMPSHNDFDNAAFNNSILDMPSQEQAVFNDYAQNADLTGSYFEEDVENINPFTNLPMKRSRTEKELQMEERKAQESARILLHLIKNESTRTGDTKLNFNELVTPNATTAEQVQRLNADQRRNMAKKASHDFYALLELRKSRKVEVEQEAAYKPIFVTLT